MPFGEDALVNVGARASFAEYNPSSDHVRQKFTGYQKDAETQLDFAEARMYENRFGRFTAVDPLLASGRSANPQSFNRYVYVNNDPILLSDPTGLDPWWKGNCNQQTNRCSYREAKEKPTDGTWEAVTFNELGYTTVAEWNDTGQTAYLYAGGGQDFGRIAQFSQSMMENNRLANGYNDPKLVALRNPGVAERGGDAMWAAVPFLNIIPGTYNLGAGGVNYFGGNMPYAPTFAPDENTSDAGRAFYYGTSGALLIQGGVSTYRGVRNFFSLEGTTNLVSPERTVHILAGDATGGGHAWFRSWQSTWNGLSRKKTCSRLHGATKK
jgi:RHS repeat-associated protein